MAGNNLIVWHNRHSLSAPEQDATVIEDGFTVNEGMWLARQRILPGGRMGLAIKKEAFVMVFYSSVRIKLLTYGRAPESTSS